MRGIWGSFPLPLLRNIYCERLCVYIRRAHCHTTLHRVLALPRTHCRALPQTAACTSTHCQLLPHCRTLLHCHARTAALPHTAAHYCAHCHTLPLAPLALPGTTAQIILININSYTTYEFIYIYIS
jgi:hypothetical protein